MSIKPETLALRCLREIADENETNDQLTESQWIVTVYGELKSVDHRGLLLEALRVADGYELCHWEDACRVKGENKWAAQDELDESNRWGHRAHLLRKALYGAEHEAPWQPSRLSHIA